MMITMITMILIHNHINIIRLGHISISIFTKHVKTFQSLHEVHFIALWIVCKIYIQYNVFLIYLLKCLYELPYITLWIICMKSTILPYELSVWSPLNYVTLYELPLWSPLYYLMNCLHEVPYITLWIVCMKSTILPYELPLWSPLYYLMNCLHEVPYITLWIVCMKSTILWAQSIKKQVATQSWLLTYSASLYTSRKSPAAMLNLIKKIFYYNFKLCRTSYLCEAQNL